MGASASGFSYSSAPCHWGSAKIGEKSVSKIGVSSIYLGAEK
jgi:hypothetical protein